jgi:beta-lactamase regulating signal transducer with metallopeptidase domain
VAVLASFPGLTLLEWTGARPSPVLRATLAELPDGFLTLVVNAYAAGSVMMLGLLAHSAVRLSVLRSYSAPLEIGLPAEWNQEAQSAGQSYLLQTVALLRNGQLSAPTSFGILRPAIVLPDPPVGTIYRNFVRAVLVHELIKTLRFDALWMLLARLVQCAFFAHPLAWRAFRHYCLAREQVCDRWAVRTTGEVSEYEDHLLAMNRLPRRRAAMSLDMPMDWTGYRGVRKRIKDLQNYERPESLDPWPTLMAAVIWMLLLAVVAAVGVAPAGGAAFSPVIHIRAMLMGAAGALAAGSVLAMVILVARNRGAQLTPPIDGIAGRSRQTVVECVQRIEREWQSLRIIISGTAQGLEPVLFMVFVLAATVGLWWIAGGSGTVNLSGPFSEARMYELYRP